MKTIKKFGAVLLAVVMVMGLCVTGFADDGGFSITISNATIGETYTAYKIFDATVGTDNDGNTIVAYSITSDNPFYNAVSSSGLFTLTETNTSGTYTVQVGENASEEDIVAFFKEIITVENGVLTNPSMDAAAESVKATTNTVKINLDEAGYYFVTSSLGSVVTVTTTDPDAVVIDKNFPPQVLYKEIVIIEENEEERDVHSESEAIGDDVEFKVAANVPLYAPGDNENPEGYLVTDYEFDDSMTSGIDIEGLEAGEDYTVTADGKYYATNSLINKWIHLEENGITYYLVNGTIDGIAVNGVAYNVVLELTNPTVDEAGDVHFDGFALTYDTVDKSADYSDVTTAAEIETTYPVNATIFIDYEAHVTDEAVYENENDIDMVWHMTTFRGPTPSEPAYRGTDSEDAEVYVWELDVLKVDAETGTVLSGAQFELAGTNLHDVVINNTYTFTPVEGMEAYTAAKNAGAVLWFELKDVDEENNNKYTTVDPYTLEKDDTALDAYVTNGNEELGDDDPDKDYIYTAYTRTTETTTHIESTENHTVTGTTDSSGVVSFKGLSQGSYSLKEIVAPDGYNLLPDNIYFTLTYDEEAEAFTFAWVDEDGNEITGNVPGSVDMFDGVISITVQDNAGTELPGTGSIGTTIFYVIGAILVVGAAVILITRKRMSHEA